MKRVLPLAIALALFGCASPPEPEVLSPYGREAINSDAAIEEYRQQSSAEIALRRDRTELQRKVDALQQQLAEMKAYIIMQAAERSVGDQPGANRPATKAKDSAPEAAAQNVDDRAAALPGSVEVLADSVVFRVFQPYASTVFQPSVELAKSLLKAANEGHSVVIRGRTDSNYANDSNQRVALARGVAARDYLVAHGVNAAKIRVYFLSTGDFLADNRTDAGRALNRRVEVEAKGIETGSYQSQKNI